MHIVYACDDNFAEIAGISIISLFENNKEVENITVYLLTDGITKANKEKIQEISRKYERDINFVDMPNMNSLIGMKVHCQRWSLSTFSRLFMSSLLPLDIERVLYIDCDTIIRGPISPVWNIKLEKNFVAGVQDCIGNQYKKNLGLKKDSIYINAGILLVDLDKWRSSNIEVKFLEFIRDFKGNIAYVDQGVINGVLNDKKKSLPPKYNSITLFFDFSYKHMLKYRKPYLYYNESEIEEAVSKPVIVHFTTSFLSLRPWIKGCKHPFAKEFLFYKGLSPWVNEQLREDNRSILRKIYCKIYYILPLPIGVTLSSWLHSMLVPWWQGRKRKDWNNNYGRAN